MPSIFVPTPQFPNVPPFPGVPALPRSAATSLAPPQITGLTGDGPGVSDTPTQYPQWGIFDSGGNPVLVGDTAFEMQYLREYKVSDYPVEQGAFASYNKVQLPFVGSFVFLKGGTVSEKADFLSLCETTTKILDLFTVITPEVSYQNVNVTRYTYDRRAAKGVGLMYVEVYFEEIRVAPAPKFTKSTVASPNSADPTNTGTVSPQTPTAAQTQPVTTALTASGG